jgi:NADH:ubiquinone oxidoreductase subunit 4 (subunit M)
VSAVYVIPILLVILTGLVLAVVTWGLWRSQNQRTDSLLIGRRGDVLVWLLILAAFTLGIFITYILMGFQM